MLPDDYQERLKAKLAPETVGGALIRAGALLTGYELVKESILNGPRDFFAQSWDENGRAEPSETYLRDVKALDPRSTFRASVRWLVEAGALTEDHVASLDRIRDHRGDVAHELARLLVDPDAEMRDELLLELRDCMVALDRFWGGIEIDLNPDLHGNDVQPEDVKSGTRLLFDYLLQVSGLDQAE